MLAADKLQLQSALKQQATALKEKEFNLHHSNLMTVGTQAAVLAGLDITMFVEFSPRPEQEWGDHMLFGRFLLTVYYGVIVAAFCANIVVVSHTTTLSVLGAGLALRGPDGSMMTATDGLFEERRAVFQTFGLGLSCTVGSVLVSVWLALRWEAAAVCWIVAACTCRTMYKNYVRVVYKFGYDERLTVDFRDILEGPANIRGVLNFTGSSSTKKKNKNSSGGNSKKTAIATTPQQQQQQQRRDAKRSPARRTQSDLNRRYSYSTSQNNGSTDDDDDDHDHDEEDVEMQRLLIDNHHHHHHNSHHNSVKQRRAGSSSPQRSIEPIQTI